MLLEQNIGCLESSSQRRYEYCFYVWECMCESGAISALLYS